MPRVAIVTAEESREIDRLTIERHGTPGHVLMERAGTGAVQAILDEYPLDGEDSVIVVAGKGNNAGDGFVVARLLLERGIPVRVLLTAPRSGISGDAERNLVRLCEAGGETRECPGPDDPAWTEASATATILVDALLGTGARGAPRPPADAWIEAMNDSGIPIVSLDLPSGVDATNGETPGAAIGASLTATFGFPKLGLFLRPGVDHIGWLRLVDLGFAPAAVAEVSPTHFLATVEDLREGAPERERHVHKGDAGRLLCVGGAEGMTGSIVLSARAAMKAGAGLVRVASPSPDLAAYLAATPEVMKIADLGALELGDPLRWERLIDGAHALVVGPGFGASDSARELARWLAVTPQIPLILDADGLNALAGEASLLANARGPRVVTPHPGEAARLLDCSIGDVEGDRPAAARELAHRTRAVVVLKGALSWVADPGGIAAVVPTGNPAMASGGMGDALSGIVGALLAARVEPFTAARAATFWHGMAGDLAVPAGADRGLLASELIEALPRALAESRDES